MSGYHDCTITVEMFHGVSDGVRLMNFMQTDNVLACRQITKAVSNKYSYGISMNGEVSFGKGIDEHIAKVVMMLCVNTSPIIIEIVKYKDTYYMTYCTHLEHKGSFVETVAEFGM